MERAESEARLDAALADAVASRRAHVEFRGVETAVIRVRKPLAAWQHVVFAAVAIGAAVAGFVPMAGLVVVVWALGVAGNRERFRLTVDPATGHVREDRTT